MPNAVRCDISAFFVSIDSYVALAEKLSLPLLNELMPAYFSLCADAIQHEGGIVDKFVGDVVAAFFGAPHPLPDHPHRACLAALRIQDQASSLPANPGTESQKWPETALRLRVRIGINSGSAIVGNLGPETRSVFTMMGDNVNLASRLEKLAKTYGAGIVCTASTKERCDRVADNQILFRSLGKILVMGRPEPVQLFEPIGLSGTATDTDRECVRLFESGLDLLRARDWTNASEQFRKSAALERHRPMGEADLNPSVYFLSTAEAFQRNPPPHPVIA